MKYSQLKNLKKMWASPEQTGLTIKRMEDTPGQVNGGALGTGSQEVRLTGSILVTFQ